MPCLLQCSPPLWVACPRCHGRLVEERTALACDGCRESWPQQAGHIDLLPAHMREPAAGGAAWQARLAVSARYYDRLLADPERAALSFASDFAHFSRQLARCSGRVLDIGGGNGLARAFLPAGVEYVSLDPDTTWLDARWDALADAFPCLTHPLLFIRGAGEALPCAEQSFDGALALFSINHAHDPGRVFREVARVLRPGAPFLVVLEDVEPTWTDLRRDNYVDWRGWPGARVVLEKLKAAVGGWPLEADHVRITEPQVAGWIEGLFTVRDRRWCGSYLAYDLRRRPFSQPDAC